MAFALELGGRQTVFHIGTIRSTGMDSVGLHKRTAEGSQGEELMEVPRRWTCSQRGWGSRGPYRLSPRYFPVEIWLSLYFLNLKTLASLRKSYRSMNTGLLESRTGKEFGRSSNLRSYREMSQKMFYVSLKDSSVFSWPIVNYWILTYHWISSRLDGAKNDPFLKDLKYPMHWVKAQTTPEPQFIFKIRMVIV